MALIVGIEPNDDLVLRYCRAFRQAYVYTHPTLASTSPVHALVTCFDAEANPAAIDAAVRTLGVRFVTGSGHGLYDRYTGFGGVTIWDTAAARPRRIAGTIIHLLSCQVGGLLGRLLVQQGATAFWGYTVDFGFYHAASPPSPLEADSYAAPFFRLDAIVDRGVLPGLDAHTIYSGVETAFWQEYVQLMSRPYAHGPLAAALLLDDFVHLVCPVTTWGDPAATL